MGGEVIAGAGALLDLGAAVGHGLAHLARHQRGELVAACAQHAAGGPHEPRALVEAGAAPTALRLGRAGGLGGSVLRAVAWIGLAGLQGRGVGGGK